MKKAYLSLFLAIATSATLFGCSVGSRSVEKATNSESSSPSQPSQSKVEDVYKYNATVDWVNASKNLKDLYENSSFVAIVKAGNVKSHIDDSKKVTTTFTPTVIETFKGECDGKQITTLGGVISFTDYIVKVSTELPTAIWSKSDSPKTTEYSFAKIPIVKDGDSFIVFCSEIDGKTVITNSFEGLFKIDGDYLINDAINSTPLKSDICGDNSSKILKSTMLDKLKAL